MFAGASGRGNFREGLLSELMRGRATERWLKGSQLMWPSQDSKAASVTPATKPVLSHHRRHSRAWCGFEEVVCFPLSPFPSLRMEIPSRGLAMDRRLPTWAGEANVSRLQGRAGSGVSLRPSQQDEAPGRRLPVPRGARGALRKAVKPTYESGLICLQG